MAIVSAINSTTATELPCASAGEVLAELPLKYCGKLVLPIRFEMVGKAGDPVLIVAGGISAGRHVVANRCDPTKGWWQSQSMSFAKYRLLAIDWIAADGELDRPIDPSDQARAIVAVLDSLEIASVSGFIGASYGGMVGMHFSAIAPARLSSLLSISAPREPDPYSSALRALQRQLIELCEQSGHAEAGVALARKLAILTYRTREEFQSRFRRELVVEGGRANADCEVYLNHMGERFSRQMSPAAYRRLSESIDLHSIEPRRIGVPSTFVSIASDQLVPAADIAALAREVPDGRLLTLASLYGHDAFLKEERAVAEIIRNFLNSLEKQA